MIRFLQTPGPMKKIILGGLLLVICAAMVITLVPGGVGSAFGFGAPPRGVVARVAGEDVTTLEVQREARQMLRQQMPKAGAQAAMLLPFFASRAADNLINQKVLLVEAERLGLRVNDEELRDELQHGRYANVFFPDGKFIGQDEYEARLRQADISVPEFEEGLKSQILFDKLRNLVTASAAVTDAEVRKEFERRNSKVKFDYAVLNKDDLLKSIHPTDAELKSFYERNKATYNNSIPEKRKLRYVVLETAKVEAQTQVTPDDLQAYYDQHRDEFRVPEQVNVRHILIKTPLPGPDGKVDTKGAEEARKKAEDVLKQIKAGGNFAELSKKYSEDPGSAKNGGSLGWIGKGRTVPEFEKAAFSLPKGGTSDLVQLPQGVVVYEVTAIKPPATPTFEEIRSRVETEFKNERVAALLSQKTKELSDRAKAEHDFKKAAKEVGATVKTTDFVLPDGQVPDLGNLSGPAAVIFSMKPGEISGPIENGNIGAVLSLLEKQEPSAQDFAAKKDQIRDSLLQGKQQELFGLFVQNLREQMQKSGKIKINEDEMKSLSRSQAPEEG